MLTLQKQYEDHLRSEGFSPDPQQELAVQSLQRLLKELSQNNRIALFSRKKDIKGVYLHGGVGRGKSMVMDLFFETVPSRVKKRRVHFHEFMIETHDWLHQYRGEGMDDLLPSYANHVAKNTKLICFDEFHVTNVVDAMILGRLFTALIEEGVVVVATSNWAPDDLYEGGLQRELFLPFIKLLNSRLEVIHLDSDTDYRQMKEQSERQVFFYPLNDETQSLFEQRKAVRSKGNAFKIEIVHVKGRDIEVSASGKCVSFEFSELFQQPLAAEDYLAIASKYSIIFLNGVPALKDSQRNEAKRFILFIDCLYELKSRLLIRSAVPFTDLYKGDDHGFEFDRTISRLQEMQSDEWECSD